jgi:hypothetical protein
MLTNAKSDAEGLKLVQVLNQRRGHKILRITVILSVLAGENETATICWPKEYEYTKRKFLLLNYIAL